jgi:asparagine synthase (glutamine-hydrolysing)
MSGGLDSTLVTAMAREEHPSIVAFNASLVDEEDVDEGRWAELAAKGLGVELDTVSVTTPEWRAALVAAVAHHEYPLPTGASPVSVSLIAGRARERGVKVLLVGEAADELFGGYPIAHGAAYRRFLAPGHMLRRMAQQARRPAGIRHLGRVVLAHLRGREPYSVPIDVPAAVSRWREATAASAGEAYAHHSGPRRELETALLSAMTAGSLAWLLNRMDKDAMARSIETRVPFLDPDVVELALNLPLEHRVAPASKGVLRDVAGRWIPEQIVRRPKQPGMSFRSGDRIEAAARPDFLRQGYLREALGLSLAEWDALTGAVDDRTRLWTGEIWCRLFIEGQSVGQVEHELWVPARVDSRAEPALAAG